MAVEKNSRKKTGKTPEPAEVCREAENKFTKEQIVSSGRFRDRRDLAEALLEEGKMYTAEDVEEKMEKYMKGKVK